MSTLDSILDSALDDFEELELKEKAAIVSSNSKASDEGITVTSVDQEREKELENMRRLLSEMNNPDYGSTLQSTLRSLSETSGGIQDVDALFEQLNKQFDAKDLPSIVPTSLDDENILGADRRVAATLQKLGEAQSGMVGMEASRLEDAGETMMQDMVGLLSYFLQWLVV